MKLFRILSVICLVALFMLPLVAPWAQDQNAASSAAAGAVEIKFLNDVMTGALGFALGLIVVCMGLFMVARNNLAGGITLVVLGVLLTLVPGVYNSLRTLACPAVSALTGGDASCH